MSIALIDPCLDSYLVVSRLWTRSWGFPIRGLPVLIHLAATRIREEHGAYRCTYNLDYNLSSPFIKPLAIGFERRFVSYLACHHFHRAAGRIPAALPLYSIFTMSSPLRVLPVDLRSHPNRSAQIFVIPQVKTRSRLYESCCPPQDRCC